MLRVMICGDLPAEFIHRCRAELGVDHGDGPGVLPPVDLSFASTDGGVRRLLTRRHHHLFVSVGAKPRPFLELPLDWRRRWYHFDARPDVTEVHRAIHETYLSFTIFPSAAAREQPLVSVFTPTHNAAPFLSETYQSLRDQTYANWEWVVIDDGSADGTPDLVRTWARDDLRIGLFFPDRGGLANIGRIKRYATGLCRGEYLVELDHDDRLTDVCLEEVVKAFEADPELGMVHSNFAEFLPDGSAYGYPEWQERGRYRTTEYRGQRYLEARAYDLNGDLFGVGPIIGQMAVCPNHVRAWRASELHRVGGFNPDLVLADDYELMVRCFLESKIGLIDRLLYLYRMHDNTWSRFTTFSRWSFRMIYQRYAARIEARVAELKAADQWNPEPQGRLPDDHPILTMGAEAWLRSRPDPSGPPLPEAGT